MISKLEIDRGEILDVIVLCNSKFQEISKDNETYRVRLKSSPLKGKANLELLKLFKSLGYNVEIIKGKLSNKKTLKVL